MGNYQIFSAVFLREYKVRKRYKLDFWALIIRPMINILPYIFFIEYMFLNDNLENNINISDYRMYLIVSVITINFVSNTISDSMTSIVGQIQQGSMEVMAVMPVDLKFIWGVELLFSGVLQMSIAVCLFTVLCIVEKINIIIYHPLIFLYVLFCTFCLNIGIGILLSGITLQTKMTKMAYMLISILMFTAGEIYPITVFPKFLRLIALCNPLTYLLDIVRYSILGTNTYFAVKMEMFWLLILSVVFILYSFFQCEMLLKRMKKEGNLTKY